MTILEKIKFEEDWLSEVNLTKENIKIAFAGIRATVLEQQPSDDAISRADALRHRHLIYDDDGVGYSVVRVDEIEQLQSVTPQPKIGKWIAQNVHNCHTDFKCSECGYIHSFMHLYGEPMADYTYCPDCGAKMKEVDTDAQGKMDALNIAIKALEQQSIIDKIRAEIEAEPYISKIEVLDIIDKYMAESEESE